MVAVGDADADRSQPCPAPILRNLERHFVLCDGGQRLFLLELPFAHEPRLFLSDGREQITCVPVLGTLLRQPSRDRGLEDGFSQRRSYHHEAVPSSRQNLSFIIS